MDLLFLLTVAPAYLVASFFVKHDPGPEEPKSAITSAVWFGVVAIGLALLLSFLFDLIIAGDFVARISGSDDANSLPLFLDVLIFATIEEFVKFIPISIYLIKKNFFNEVTDGIIYFAIVGLTFGAIESFLYGVVSGDLGFAVALMRLALGLFFHGALTAIVGYYFAKAKVTNASLVSAFVALAVVSLIHGAYNYFVFSVQSDPIFIFGAAAMALTANAAMFWLFFEATKKDIELGIAGPQFIEQREIRKIERQNNARIKLQRRNASATLETQNPVIDPQHPSNPPQNPPTQV